MKFKIVYDKPGRIRFRSGGFAFGEEMEYAVKNQLVSFPYITKAEVNSENGGILVYYDGEHRDDVINQIAILDPRILEPVKPDCECMTEEIDSDFKDNIVKLVVKRFVQKAFLPLPVANAITFIKGIGYVWKGIRTLFDGKLTVDVLDGASVGACLAQKNYSTAGTIMFLLSVSSLLEDYTRARTRAALTESLMIKTDNVWLITDDSEVSVPLSEIQPGDRIRIRTGSIIPVDGEVCDGEAYVNESSMTGEPLAVMRKSGDSVFAGTVVEEGSLAVIVRNLSSDTKINKIIELIDNSENLKAGVQSRAENLADRIVPFSFLGFGLTLLLTRNITKAVSVLMVDYSCAIKLSTPISVISAIKEAADMDITVKGGKYFEEFAVADTIIFDKTGTLTNASPVLEKVITFGKYTEEQVLRTAACLEEHFPHSVANAVVKGAADSGITHEEEHAEVDYIVAHGIASTLKGKRAVIGSRHFVCEDEGINISSQMQKKVDEQSGACSVIYLAIGGKLAGALCISDPPRPEAYDVINRLKQQGIKNVVMLTGDSSGAAAIIAENLGITEYKSQVLPEDKHSYIENMKAQGHRVIMVGDGINDAPALAAADVSVAMSDASDIAKETADITLRGANLISLTDLRKLSARLMERIEGNYQFILGFNSLLLLSGLSGLMTPAMSAFLHNASTMAICAKSMGKLIDNKK